MVIFLTTFSQFFPFARRDEDRILRWQTNDPKFIVALEYMGAWSAWPGAHNIWVGRSPNRRVSVFNENDYYYCYFRNDGDNPEIMCCNIITESLKRIKQITKFYDQTKKKMTLACVGAKAATVAAAFCMAETWTEQNRMNRRS